MKRCFVKQSLPVVQIGPFSEDPTESVSVVNRTFVGDLSRSYTFVPYRDRRRYGATRQGMLNATNGYYFLKHLTSWLWCLARYRPAVTHYAISSGWAFQKGLVFLKLGRAFGAKTLGHLHSGSFIGYWRSLPEWRKKLALREIAQLDGMVVLSEFWRDEIVTHLRVPREKLFVVNNPIGRDFEEAALQMPADRPQTIVLSLGVMGRDKGVMDILQAVSLLRRNGGPSGGSADWDPGGIAKFKLQLAGPEREPGIHARVQQFVTEHAIGDFVSTRASIWGQEKIQLFRDTSISLLPSYYENFPLVVLEAAAAGHAIITTPVGAIPEFFTDGCSALFVEPGKPGQIARAINRLVENPEERARLGRAAREIFTSRLARAKIMNSLDRVYQKVLEPMSAELCTD